MAQDTILGTDTVKDALLTKLNGDIEEIFTEIAAIYVALAAAIAGSGCWVSANDTTTGYLNGKLVADSYGLLTLVELDDGANESLSICTDALEFDSFFMSML